MDTATPVGLQHRAAAPGQQHEVRVREQGGQTFKRTSSGLGAEAANLALRFQAPGGVGLAGGAAFARQPLCWSSLVSALPSWSWAHKKSGAWTAEAIRGHATSEAAHRGSALDCAASAPKAT